MSYGPEPRNPKYATWSKRRRFEKAVELVVDHGWTQEEAAIEVGVSRPRLSPKVREFREQRERKVAQAKAEGQIGTKPTLPPSTRVFTGTFEEFDERYFSNLICPDCEVHHDRPWFHEEMMQAVQSDSMRVLINIPPYHAKSTLITVKYALYQIARNPNIRIIIISKSQGMATTFLHSISTYLTNREVYGDGPNLIDDFGPFRPEGQGASWSATRIYVANRTSAEKDPTVQVLGVGNQIYGRRADLIICDDIADVENQNNPDQVQKMLTWLKREAFSRVGKSGKVVIVGTRVNAGDVYSHLKDLEGYRVLRYPVLFDESREGEEEVLWPEHFPYRQVLVHRSEMTPTDFQLIYQNVDLPGVGASFPPELVDEVKDVQRVLGHYDPHWRLVAGLDPAGANRDSGFTAMVLLGVDLQTGKRHLVDIVNYKQMRAPLMKDQMLEWSEHYPIYEWRVENNGLQSQIIQYDQEIIRKLALVGTRVRGHNTHTNKWDPQFGVESIAPLFQAGLYSIPWGNAPTAKAFQPVVDQLIGFPMATIQDVVMALWFAELGVRDLLRRDHLPMFDSRMKVPERIRRRRVVVDFNSQEVRRVPVEDQSPRSTGLSVGQMNYRRMTVGRPTRHADVAAREPEEAPAFVNVEGRVGPSAGR